MMIQSGMRFFNKTSNIDFLVCHLSSNGIFCATYDLNINKDKVSFMKPEKHLVSSIAQMIRSRSLEHIRYTYPTILTQSDPWIVKELGKQKWIEKRDKKVAELHSLTCPTLIEQYLYGKGLGDEIQLLIPHSRWNHKDQYYRELNRFIFSCSMKMRFYRLHLTIVVKTTGMLLMKLIRLQSAVEVEKTISIPVQNRVG